MSDRYRVMKWDRPHAPNAAMLRLQLESEGFSVIQWSDRPGQVYGMHKHERAQTHWVVSGELELKIEHGGLFTLGPGDRDHMPAEMYHSARVIGDEPVVYMVGEAKPAKKKRGRPKKAVKKSEELPEEVKNLISRFF